MSDKKRYHRRTKDGKENENVSKSSSNSTNKNTSSKEEKVPDNQEAMADAVKKGPNSASWYSRNPEMLKSSSTFPFNTILGRPYKQWKVGAGVGVNEYTLRVTPGIMTIHFTPTYGVSLDSSSAINLAGDGIFKAMAQKFSNNKRYDSQDVMMYLMAMDSAMMWRHILTRVYSVLQLINLNNMYLRAKSLVTAMGFDYDSFVPNLTMVREMINDYSRDLSNMTVPAVLPIFARHAEMCRDIFKDDDTVRSQLYMFVPDNLYRWNEVTEQGEPPYLEPFRLFPNGEPITLERARQIGKDISNRITQSQDFLTISSDLHKTFDDKEDLFITLGTVTERDITLPFYSAEMLMQIENSQGLNLLDVDDPDSRITQVPLDEAESGGYIKFDPVFSSGAGQCASQFLINFHYDEPTPTDTMVATRLNVCIDEARSDFEHNKTKLSSCGAEVITGYRMWKYDADNPQSMTNTWFSSFLPVSAQHWNVMQVLGLLDDISEFRQSPVITVVDFDDATQKGTILNRCVESSNFTWLRTEDLDRMNRVACYSLFGVPMDPRLSF